MIRIVQSCTVLFYGMSLSALLWHLAANGCACRLRFAKLLPKRAMYKNKIHKDTNNKNRQSRYKESWIENCK